MLQRRRPPPAPRAVGNPWSAYGETIIVAVQSVAILAMIWAYSWPGLLEVSAVLGVLAAATQGAYMSGPAGQHIVQQLTIVLFAASRGFQVWENFAQVRAWCCPHRGLAPVLPLLPVFLTP